MRRSDTGWRQSRRGTKAPSPERPGRRRGRVPPARAGGDSLRDPDVPALGQLLLVVDPVPKWRRARGRNPLALVQSPHKWLKKVDADARIIAITGSEDENTFPDLARDYVEKARARGIDAEFVLVKGAGHGLDRRYRELLTEAIEQLLGR